MFLSLTAEIVEDADEKVAELKAGPGTFVARSAVLRASISARTSVWQVHHKTLT
jgi:hypothetical protein